MNRQPYQEASDQIQDQAEQPGRVLRSAAGTAASLATGGALATRLLPFLSSYIPANLAIKGISKISPTLGKFVKGSIDNGREAEDVLDFVKSKISGEEEQKENPQEKRNILEQYSPELFRSIQDQIQQGKSPRVAAMNSKAQAFFRDSIAKMEKDHKIPFENIVESIFGGGQMAQKQPGQPQQEQQSQGGQATQALMQALQLAAASRQKRSGMQ